MTLAELTKTDCGVQVGTAKLPLQATRNAVYITLLRVQTGILINFSAARKKRCIDLGFAIKQTHA